LSKINDIQGENKALGEKCPIFHLEMGGGGEIYKIINTCQSINQPFTNNVENLTNQLKGVILFFKIIFSLQLLFEHSWKILKCRLHYQKSSKQE